MKGLVGSTESPELGRTLTYNVYAKKVRAYKRRNLQAASRIVAQFAREHPDLFVGVNLDADTYMNPFPRRGPVVRLQPRHAAAVSRMAVGHGAVCGQARARRAGPLALSPQARAHAAGGQRARAPALDEVGRGRSAAHVPGVRRASARPGETPFWEDPWYLEWDAFRRHIVGLHYSELSEWAHEAGIPSERIFSAQAFIAPDPGMRPVAINIRGETPDYDSAGVSIEGSVPSAGHLGTILYGPAAANEHPMSNGHSLFATIARFDPSWAIVEMNATDLKQPMVPPGLPRAGITRFARCSTSMRDRSR